MVIRPGGHFQAVFIHRPSLVKIGLEDNMSLETMLAALTPSEKLEAMNILWRDLSKNPADFASPEWHGDVLTDRIANPSDEPRLPLDAAFDDVKDRLNARRTQG
jgi:hypothetical protein